MLIVKNKEAYFHYTIEEVLEVGIVLNGTEVKALRNKEISLSQGYIKIDSNLEAWLVQVHIAHYSFGNIHNHENVRSRKLLLHKKEILKIKQKIKIKRLVVIPLEVYFNKKRKIKILIGLGKGKKLYDKRQSLKEKDLKKIND
jgi:SsrA-binding protein